MDSYLSADAILAQVPQAHTKSAAGKRKFESAVVFVATIASLATGVIGFVDAYQQPGKQNFLLGLVGCAVVLLMVRFMQWRRRFAAHVPYIAAQTQVPIGSDFLDLLASRVIVSRMAHLFAWFVRKLDNLAWLLLVSTLSLSAGAVFVLSAFGLYTAFQNQLDVIDLVLLIGLVRPLRSAVSGIQRFRRQSTGSRQRVQTFSKSFHYAVESVHVYIDKLSQSTVGVLNASASAASKVSVGLATTASTVVVSVAVSGVGLASAHVAPQAVIATGEVIPLPPAVVQFAGPEGREAEIRGAVFYGCVGSLLDNAQPADEQCQTAVQQSNDSCLGWQGGALPPECANALSGVLPQVVDSMQSNGSGENVDGSRGKEGDPRNPTDPNRPPRDPQQQNQADSGAPGTKSGPCVAAPGSRPCPSENPAGQSGGQPGQQPLPSQGGSPGGPPPPGRTPGSPPPGGSDGAPPSEGGTPGSPPGGSDGAPPSEGGTSGSPPGGSDGAAPPRATDGPPPTRRPPFLP